MEVSWNRGTPKSAILGAFSLINPPFWIPPWRAGNPYMTRKLHHSVALFRFRGPSMTWRWKLSPKSPGESYHYDVGKTIINHPLLGGWATPLKNMKVSWDDDIPNINGKIENGNQTTNQIINHPPNHHFCRWYIFVGGMDTIHSHGWFMALS